MTDPLEPLKKRFRARVMADRAELDILAAGDRASPVLRRLAHNLAGTAGTFGYAGVSLAAARVDDEMSAGDSAGVDSLDLLKQRLDEIVDDEGDGDMLSKIR